MAELRTPVVLRGSAENLDMLVEAAAAAYFGGAEGATKAAPTSSPRSKAQNHPQHSRADGEAGQSPGSAAQQTVALAAKGSHAQEERLASMPHARKLETPETTARGRATARKSAKPWWVV